MKRSFVTALVAASMFTFGACAGDDTDTEIEPVEEVPAPAPAPPPMPIDTTMPDTLTDTIPTTTTNL